MLQISIGNSLFLLNLSHLSILFSFIRGGGRYENLEGQEKDKEGGGSLDWPPKFATTNLVGLFGLTADSRMPINVTLILCGEISCNNF